MKTCDTCKWWGIQVFTTKRECTMAQTMTGYNHADGDAGVTFNTYDGSTELHTGPKFGCVHHEPKEEGKK